jgi:hypothetical protein
MAGGGDDFHVLHAHLPEIGGDELGGAADIILVLGQSAYTGNAEQVFEFAQEALLIALIAYVADGGRHKDVISPGYKPFSI